MLNERKLTDGELKKRDEIVKAIKRDRKEENLTDEEVYAIATAQAKKTNEGIMDPYERLQAIKEAVEQLSFPEVQKEFEKRYGVNARNKDNLVELSRKANAARNPKRAAMAKKILDMAKNEPDAFEDPASRK
jgi:hypothetical protein